MTAALLAGPVGAGAEVLNLGFESEAIWTDNVFGTFENEVDDTSGRVAPWGEVTDRDGRVTWGFRYQPAYEYYLDQDGLRGFDHDVSANVAFRFSPATTLRISDQFARYRSLSRFNDQAEPGGEINVVGFRQRFKRNRLNATLTHSLSARDVVSLSAGYNYFEFSNTNNADRDNIRTSLAYTRQLSERTTVGTSLAWTQQTFERPGFDQRSTDFYNLAATVSHQFDRSLRLDLSAGPALIESESEAAAFNDVDPMSPGTQVGTTAFPLFRLGNGSFRMVDADTCPLNDFGERVLALECQTLPPDISSGLANSFGQFNVTAVDLTGDLVTPSDSRFTYFAAASLSKEWERWRASLSYSRSFSDSTAAAAVADVVIGRVTWSPGRRWTAEFSASYERQEQATEGAILTTVVANAPTPDPMLFPPNAARAQALRVETIDSDASLDFVRLFFRLTYQLTRRSSVYALVNWREESLNGDFVVRPDSDRFVVGIGLNYDFDPIPF